MVRRDYLSLQEHRLTASSVLGVFNTIPELYESHPHTPLGILEETISVEECDNERKKIKALGGCGVHPGYWEMEGICGTMELARLCLVREGNGGISYGETLHDPKLIRINAIGIAASLYDKMERKFHYQREPLRIARDLLFPPTNIIISDQGVIKPVYSRRPKVA